MTYLYIGRFQPLHNGHMSALHEMVKDGRIIIVIGSAQENWTKKNPFTASERFEMIWNAVTEVMLGAYITMIPMVDIKENNLWVQHIKGMVPSFDAVYSNNPLSRALFKEEGYDVYPEKPDRSWISATKIREIMVSDMADKKDWKILVPDAISEYIEEHDLVSRLREIEKDE